MARQDAHIEYIISQESYALAYSSLPETGTPDQQAESVRVPAKQYRLNQSQTVNAGKWVMWAIEPETFMFTWKNGAWQPPANLVVLRS